jgi:hypothetical protein
LIYDSAIEDAQQKKSINEKNLAATKQKIADSKLDVDAVMDKAEIYRLIKEQKRSPLPSLTLITAAIKSPIVIKDLKWELNPKPEDGAGAAPAPSPAAAPSGGAPGMPNAASPSPPILNPAVILSKDDKIVVEVKVDFPVGIKNAAMYKTYTEELIKSMQADLPGYSIFLSEPPTEYRDTDNLRMSFDQENGNQKSTLGEKPIPAIITIAGPFVVSITEVEAP